MNHKISILVEDEDDNIICNLSITDGMEDFEENVIRKAEHAIKKYEREKLEEEQILADLEDDEDED